MGDERFALKLVYLTVIRSDRLQEGVSLMEYSPISLPRISTVFREAPPMTVTAVKVTSCLSFGASARRRFRGLILRQLRLGVVTYTVAPVRATIFVNEGCTTLIIRHNPVVVEYGCLIVVSSVGYCLRMRRHVVVNMSGCQSPFRHDLCVQITLLRRSKSSGHRILTRY